MQQYARCVRETYGNKNAKEKKIELHNALGEDRYPTSRDFALADRALHRHQRAANDKPGNDVPKEPPLKDPISIRKVKRTAVPPAMTETAALFQPGDPLPFSLFLSLLLSLLLAGV
jgi:hypothetical protein